MHAEVAGVAAATALAVLWTGYRWLAWGLCLTLLSLVAANGSLPGLKHDFLTARWAALFTLAAILFWRLVRRHERPCWAIVWLAALPLLAALSAAWSVDPRLTLERAGSFALLLWALSAVALELRDRQQLSAMVDALGATSVGVLIASLLVAALSSHGVRGSALEGVFENPNGLGIFLGLTLPLVLARLERRYGPRLNLPVAAVYIAVIAATQSRGAFVAVGIGLITYYLAQRRRKRFMAAIVPVVLVGGAVGLAVRPLLHSTPHPAQSVVRSPILFSAPGSTAPPRTPHNSNPSFMRRLTGGRSEGWGAAARLIGSRPVEGYGFGTGDQLFALRHVRFIFFEGANPNSAYLQLALELGILGAAVFLAPLFVGAARGVRLLRAKAVDADSAAALSMLAGGLVVGVVESVFTSAGAPWDLLIWTAALTAMLALPDQARVGASVRYAPRPIRPAHVLGPAVIAAVVVTGMAAGKELLRSAPLTVQYVASQIVRDRCGPTGCQVVQLYRLQPGSWWLELKRPAPECFVFHPAAYRSGPAPRGIVDATCSSLPLSEPHVLTVEVTEVEPPYFVAPLSDPRGIEPELVSLLAQRLRIGLVRWMFGDAGVHGGPDLTLHALVYWHRRPHNFLPYRVFEQFILARGGTAASSVHTLAQVRQLRVGMVASTSEQFVRTRLGKKPIIYSTIASGERALQQGSIDLLVMEDASAAGLARTDRTLRVVGGFPPDQAYGMLLPRHSRLAPLVTAIYRSLVSDGTLIQIQKRTMQ